MTAADLGPVPFRRDPDFVRYWLARQISVGGSLVTAVAMPVLVYRLTGSPGLTALASALEAIPYLVFGLFAGALSDRLNRRRVMVTADLVDALVLLSVPVAWWLGVLTPAHALIVGFVSQAVFAFFDGANFGALPMLVGRDRVGDANAAIWGFGGILDLAVPMAVGALLAVVHPADLLLIDALSYVGSALLVLAIARPLSIPRADPPPFAVVAILAEVREGLSGCGGTPGSGPPPSSAPSSPRRVRGSWRSRCRTPTACCISGPVAGASVCSSRCGASGGSSRLP